MKTILRIVIIVFGSFLFFHPVVSADTIIQGNAESHTSVTTNIQGSGTVSTHIQSTVNGVTKTLDSNQPGTHTLDNSSDGSSSNQSATITTAPTATPTAKPIEPKARDHDPIFTNTIVNLKLFIHQAIQNILAAFHL